MSLNEAYRLVHKAECRLNMEASRPDRNLRFVVGHLMHYESLRLRIVEIEHDVRKGERANAAQLKHKPSTGQLGRRPPPPPVADIEDDEEDMIDDFDDEAEEAGLGLQRFPSGSVRPPPPPPLEPDDYDEDEEDDQEPVSPEEPDQATLERLVKGNGDEMLTTMYEGVRSCRCQGNMEAPKIEKMWELPSDQAGAKPGVTRMVAQVAG